MAKKKRKKSNQKPQNVTGEAQNLAPSGGNAARDNTAKASQDDVNQADTSTAQPPSQTPQQTQPSQNTGAGIGGFLQGTKQELEKVVWPDRQQLISESAAVILMVSLSAILISLIDNLFGWISQLVF